MRKILVLTPFAGVVFFFFRKLECVRAGAVAPLFMEGVREAHVWGKSHSLAFVAYYVFLKESCCFLYLGEDQD